MDIRCLLMLKKTAVGVDNEVLLKYIKDTLNGVVPEKYKEVEGRITITNGRDSMLTNDELMLKYSYIFIFGFLLMLF